LIYKTALPVQNSEAPQAESVVYLSYTKTMEEFDDA